MKVQFSGRRNKLKLGVNWEYDCDECKSFAVDFLLWNKNKYVSKEDKYDTSMSQQSSSGSHRKRQWQISVKRSQACAMTNLHEEVSVKGSQSLFHRFFVRRQSSSKVTSDRGMTISRKWKSSHRPFEVENSIRIPRKIQQSSSRWHFD